MESEAQTKYGWQVVPEWHYSVPGKSGRNFAQQLLPLLCFWLASANDNGANQLGDRSLTGHAAQSPEHH